MGYVFLAFFIVLLAVPPVCLGVLITQRGRTRAPSDLALLIYAGMFMWMFFFLSRAALEQLPRAWIVYPVPAGLLIAVAWRRCAEPPMALWRGISEAFVALVFAMMVLASVGGGYFDRVFQDGHAFKRLSEEGFDRTDAGALARGLSHEDWFVRYGAAMGLARLGEGAAPAVPELLDALHDDRPRVRETAARALGGARPLPQTLIPVIAPHLGHKEHAAVVRRLLGEMGPAGAAVLEQDG